MQGHDRPLELRSRKTTGASGIVGGACGLNPGSGVGGIALERWEALPGAVGSLPAAALDVEGDAAVRHTVECPADSRNPQPAGRDR